MGRNRFLSADSVRLPLTDGDWVEVKKDLNTGDQKRLENAGTLPPIKVDGQVINPIDWERYELERAMIFLTDWSFRGADDKPVKLTIDALRALEIESFDEVNKAIFKHVGARMLEKKALKDLTESQKTPPATSEDVLT